MRRVDLFKSVRGFDDPTKSRTFDVCVYKKKRKNERLINKTMSTVAFRVSNHYFYTMFKRGVGFSVFVVCQLHSKYNKDCENGPRLWRRCNIIIYHAVYFGTLLFFVHFTMQNSKVNYIRVYYVVSLKDKNPFVCKTPTWGKHYTRRLL